MTLLYIEGFEGYASGGNRTVLDVDYNFDELISTSEAGITSGRTGGKGVFIADGNNNSSSLRIPIASLSSQDDWVVGFAIKTVHPRFDVNTGASNRQLWLQFLDSDGSAMLSIYPAAGVLNVRTGGLTGTKLGFTETRLTTEVWHYFECKVNFHASTGSVVIHIDEEEVLNLTGVDTVGSTTDGRPSMLRVAASGNSLRTEIDDLYILDDQGSQHNDFLGDNVVERLDPVGVGNSTDFSVTGVASNWDAVDDDGPDDDTTFVESNVNTHKDTYEFSDITTTPLVIEAVATKSYDEKTDGGSRTFVHVARSGLSETDSSTHYPSVLSYHRHQSVFPTDPDTASAWNRTGVDGAEFGFKITS